jgi:hypothetical protein
MSEIYEKLLLPKMAPSQWLSVGLGLFWSYSRSTTEHDDALLAKLNGFVAWAQREQRIVLMNPRHYAELSAPPNGNRQASAVPTPHARVSHGW